MALGSENIVYYQKAAQYQSQQQHSTREVLRTRIVNHQRSIAPAPYTKPSAHNNTLAGTTLDSNNPAVVRRNARERSRVKQVNNGFSTLRQHIPTAIIAEISNGRRGIGPGADKKLSKVDTLRMAAEYIRRLKKVIDEVDNSDASSVSSYGTTSFSPCASSASETPPPASLYTNSSIIKIGNNSTNNNNTNNIYYQQSQAQQTLPQYFPTLNYVGSFQQHNLISPANSSTSNESYQFHHSPNHYQSSSAEMTTFALNTPNATPVKMEPSPFSFDDYHHNNTSSGSSTDDEELLDYISLWQDQ